MNNKFAFGKYKNKLIYDVAGKDPDYIIWAYENVKNPAHGGIDKDFYEACVMDDYENNEYEDDFGTDMWGNIC